MVSAERGMAWVVNNCCGNALLKSARLCTDGGSEEGRVGGSENWFSHQRVGAFSELSIITA